MLRIESTVSLSCLTHIRDCGKHQSSEFKSLANLIYETKVNVKKSNLVRETYKHFILIYLFLVLMLLKFLA